MRRRFHAPELATLIRLTRRAMTDEQLARIEATLASLDELGTEFETER